jgi:DNA-binding transcriptional LysR family regulator
LGIVAAVLKTVSRRIFRLKAPRRRRLGPYATRQIQKIVYFCRAAIHFRMTDPDPSWDALRTFFVVMREGTLSAAARRLKLTQPTVGRHIDSLEAALGITLFTRSSRGLAPTSAAKALAPYGEAMASAAGALTRSAATEGDLDRGVVRVTASEIVGCEVLPPIFAGFRFEHPGIAVELAVTNRNEDLTRGDADIAVRMIRPTQSGLVARRIGLARIGLYAHRDYCRRFGEPRSLDDLKRHRLIGFDRDNSSFRSAGALADALRRENFAFRCDSDVAQLAALRAGVGVGGCQAGIASRARDLVPVLPDTFQVSLEVWLAMHRDLRANRRVRLLYDWLARGLADYVRGAPKAR